MFKKFFSKQKSKGLQQNIYPKEQYKPMLKVSICTGEQVVGFMEIESGKFIDVMLVKDDKDIKVFCNTYGVLESEIGRFW